MPNHRSIHSPTSAGTTISKATVVMLEAKFMARANAARSSVESGTAVESVHGMKQVNLSIGVEGVNQVRCRALVGFYVGFRHCGSSTASRNTAVSERSPAQGQANTQNR
jgi:hypothetical protein